MGRKFDFSVSDWSLEEQWWKAQRTGMAGPGWLWGSVKKAEILKVPGGGADSTETNTKVNPKR